MIIFCQPSLPIKIARASAVVPPGLVTFFLNNSGYSGGRSVRPTSCRGVGQFGSISANSHHHQEEESGVFLGIIVASFGIAITLGLVLLPLLICCSAVTRHPLYLR